MIFEKRKSKPKKPLEANIQEYKSPRMTVIVRFNTVCSIYVTCGAQRAHLICFSSTFLCFLTADNLQLSIKHFFICAISSKHIQSLILVVFNGYSDQRIWSEAMNFF